jgi:hypothetical protein
MDAPSIITILAILAAAVFVHLRDEREIARLTADNIDLRSRLFLSKGQPPVGVDATEEYVKEQARDEEAREKRREKPPGVTLLDQARNAAAMKEAGVGR